MLLIGRIGYIYIKKNFLPYTCSIKNDKTNKKPFTSDTKMTKDTLLFISIRFINIMAI